MKSSMDGNTLIHNVLFIDKVIIYWQDYKIINKYNIQQPGINLKCYYKDYMQKKLKHFSRTFLQYVFVVYLGYSVI